MSRAIWVRAMTCRRVELAVAGAGEAVADDVSGGCVDGCGPV